MDNLWVTQIEENIATYIDAEVNETADILVTTEDYTGDTASFPAVYVHELSQVERGQMPTSFLTTEISING